MEAKIDELDSKFNIQLKAIQEENATLRKELQTTKEKLKEVDNKVEASEQRSRINNIEISCIPLTTNENTEALAIEALKTVGLQIDERDISIAHRVPTYNPGKPPNIIVHFVQRKLKFASVTAYRQFYKNKGRRPVCKDINPILGESIFYISEHLTPNNKKLLKETKQKARENKFKYVYTNDGKIFAKKDERTKAVMITKEEDLVRMQRPHHEES